MDFNLLGLLYRCSREFSHDRIHMKDLTETECMLCSFIFANPGHSQYDAAIALKTDKTTVSKALSALEDKGLIDRSQDPLDRRVKRLTLTPLGQEKLSDLMNIHNEWFSRILTCLEPDEQVLFENCCKRLLAAAQTLAENKDREDT